VVVVEVLTRKERAETGGKAERTERLET